MISRSIGFGLLIISLLLPGTGMAAITFTETSPISSLIIKQSPQTTIISSWQTLIQNHAKEIGSADADGAIIAVLSQAQADANRDLTAVIQTIENNNALKAKLRALEDALKSDQSKLNSLLSSASTLKATSTQLDAVNQTLLQTVSHLSTLQNQLNNVKDSLSDIDQQQALKLQILIDRISKFETILSNLLKKFHDTATTIIGNLK